MTKQIDDITLKKIEKFQTDEATAYALYSKIAKQQKNKKNCQVLTAFAQEEKSHSEFFEQYTGKKGEPKKFKVWWYSLLTFIFGYTFSIKTMEKNEEFTISDYRSLIPVIPDIEQIIHDEEKHEQILIDMIDEERLKYVGSMVLGLNDALVELTGTIAGLTFALQNTRLVALSGIVTGISATLSMAASNYLAESAEGSQDPLKSSIYTGVAYLITVVLMVLPYLILPNEQFFLAFIIMLTIVIVIIFLFNYYISVAKSQSFKKNFFTMAIISLSVALIAFVIGIIAKNLLGVDI